MKTALEQIEKLDDVGELLIFVRDFARSRGVVRQSYHFTPVLDAPVSESTTIYAEGFSGEWLTLYQDCEFRRHDPIPARTLRHGEAMSWLDAIALEENTPEEEAYFSAMREHGLVHGFGVPLYGAGGREAYASYDFGRVMEPEDVDAAREIRAVAQAAQKRVSRLLARNNAEPSLSDRESEVLEWLMRGKSIGDIGTILNLSPDTVRTYTKRLYDKLDTSTRIGAVVKALKMNLVRL
ncbi:autoinducer binding domain-containing protein [Qipengyuania sp. XHP0207]|uniref:helix-turn-helix transcriptional regulator n=1 Tax=Qipengyuania sp. XHP0207 TaxID=3038078 RepID=UPI00241C0245|nr:LuxR family transcriptional regulator [Qipengyuania sp. XHP0207]MDG5749421.1 autoinducer binding domain-containing protein [Qipengyuania sp. XHP0207]